MLSEVAQAVDMHGMGFMRYEGDPEVQHVVLAAELAEYQYGLPPRLVMAKGMFLQR